MCLKLKGGSVGWVGGEKEEGAGLFPPKTFYTSENFTKDVRNF